MFGDRKAVAVKEITKMFERVERFNLKDGLSQVPKGEFVLPTAESISAAASGEIPADTRCSITNADAPGAYPISTFTWMIIYKEQHYADRSHEQAVATLDLLQYILSDEAQKITAEVHYAPLPAKAKELSIENLKTVTYDGATILK